MKRWRVLLLLSFFLPSGCHKIGQQVAEGVNARKDTLADAVRPLARALVAQAGRTFDDSVRAHLVKATGEMGHRVGATLDSALQNLQRQVRLLEDSLGWFVANPGRDAVHALLTPTLAELRSSLRTSIGLWVGDFSRAIDSVLSDATARLADRAAGQATQSLARNVDSTGPLGRAVVRLGDQVVRQAIRAIRDESDKQKTPWWVWAVVAVVAVLVIVAVGTFILRLRGTKRRHEESLRAMAQAIKERNDPVLAKRVKTLAVEHGVEPSLHRFLEEQRLLVPEPGAPS